MTSRIIPTLLLKKLEDRVIGFNHLWGINQMVNYAGGDTSFFIAVGVTNVGFRSI
jgi:hypothetical protein